MSRSGDDPERRAGTDPRYDEWPVESPDDHDVSVDPKWVGVTPGEGGAGYVYDPHNEVVYESEIDEEAERITVIRRSESQPKGDESLGDWMRRTGGEEGWSSLSEYGDGQLRERPVESTFQGKNTTADEDYAFFGSYSFPGDDGREHTVEREFTIADADARPTTVTVDERHLVDTADDGADVLDSRTETFAVEGTDDERTFEEICREWHEAHPP